MAVPNCSPSYLAISEMPGPQMEDWYRDIRSQLPKSADCERHTMDSCQIADRWGYLNTFSEWGEWTPGRADDRFIFNRSTQRQQNAKLPYGVAWTDGPSRLTRRLLALGLAPNRVMGGGKITISVGGCFRHPKGRRILDQFQV